MMYPPTDASHLSGVGIMGPRKPLTPLNITQTLLTPFGEHTPPLPHGPTHRKNKERAAFMGYYCGSFRRDATGMLLKVHTRQQSTFLEIPLHT